MGEKEANCRWLRNWGESVGIVLSRNLGKSPGDEAGFVDWIGGFGKLYFVDEFCRDDVVVGWSRNDRERVVFEVCCHFAVV